VEIVSKYVLQGCTRYYNDPCYTGLIIKCFTDIFDNIKVWNNLGKQ